MSGFTLLVIRIETDLATLPTSFHYESKINLIKDDQNYGHSSPSRPASKEGTDSRSASPALRPPGSRCTSPAPHALSSRESSLDPDFFTAKSSDLKVLRGQRKPGEIRIETYGTMEADTSDPRGPEPADEAEDVPSDGRAKDDPSEEPYQNSRDPRTNRLSPNAVIAWKQRSPSQPPSHVPSPLPKEMIHFYCGNPIVEVTQGILHLYKSKFSLDERSEMVCMLSIPAVLTIHDLLAFMSHVTDGLENIKIIRDSTPSQYMALLKFKSQLLADEFYSNYNAMPFNSIEEHTCQLAYVARVEAVKGSEGACLPIPGCIELPTCPVCLERMDESVNGILTILCNHSFHSECLEKWGDTTCPVCRYCQSPESSQDNKCFECGSQESLWICLICGHVGCGRYVAGHAFNHFTITQHCYSMQLGNNRVWDYAGDNYVHRLVQNKGDGKLIEVDESGNVVEGEKLDSITLEYTYLLTSQLESQRLYFEEKMNLVEEDAHIQIDDARTQVDEMVEKTRTILLKNTELDEQLAAIAKEKTTLEAKSTKLSTKLTSVLRELQEEKALNSNLRENQSEWQKKVESLETRLRKVEEEKARETQDLREQLRDVMFYLEGQKKIEEAEQNQSLTQDELETSTISIGAEGGDDKKGRRKKKR